MTATGTRGWRELWRKEDWWAVWIGLGIVVAACIAFANGTSLRWLAVLPARWSSVEALARDLSGNGLRYLALFGFWAAVFAIALRAAGQRVAAFLPAFAILFAAATSIFVLGQWQGATAFNLEPPLLALLIGLVIANSVRLPGWFDAGLRGELYVKTGIVLLGATLPLTLIALAGPVALLQASIVSIVTFGAIYLAAVRLGLDRRFAATLGVGGAVPGKTEQALQAFTLVKVVGRDMWIGIWAVVLAIVATTRWEAAPGGARAAPREICAPGRSSSASSASG